MTKRNQRLPFVFEQGKEQELQLKLESYCAYTERCTSDVITKLKEWNVPEEQWEEHLQLLKEHKFLDQVRFGEAFTRGKFKLKGWGRNKIKAALQSKFVQPEIIVASIDQIDNGVYLEKLQVLLAKKNEQLKETDAYKRREKLFRFAAQKGYEPVLIFQALSKIISPSESEEPESN
jgi:regulatory protein